MNERKPAEKKESQKNLTRILPAAVQQTILSLLTPKQMARIAPVSKHFNTLVNTPYIWRNAIRENNIEAARSMHNLKLLYADSPALWVEADLLESKSRPSDNILMDRMMANGIPHPQARKIYINKELFKRDDVRISYLTQHEANIFCNIIEDSEKETGLRRLLDDRLISLRDLFNLSAKKLEIFQKYFFTFNGYQALKNKIITVEAFFKLSDADQSDLMNFVFTRRGIELITSGKISLDNFLVYPHELRKLFVYLEKITPEALRALEKNKISLLSLITYSEEDLKDIIELLSNNGLVALNNLKMTLRQFLEFSPRDRRDLIQILFSSNGRIALEEKIIDIPRFLSEDDRDKFRQIFTRESLAAVRQNVVSVEQLLRCTEEDRKDLIRYLFIPEGVRDLKKGLITIDQFLHASADTRFVFHLAIKKQLIEFIPISILLRLTVDQFTDINQRFFILNPYGRYALENGYITIDEYLQLSPLQKVRLDCALNPPTFDAIRLGISTLREFLNSTLPGVKPLLLHAQGLFSVSATPTDKEEKKLISGPKR